MPRPHLTSANMKRMIAVARVVVPVVTPFAIKAAGYTRQRWDVARARRLGVPLEQLPSFSGKGAALHARIASLATSLHGLGQRHQNDTETTQYVERTEQRLADLATAVRLAESMPAPRRRAAHQAVGRELGDVEAKLLARLGL